MGIRMGVDTGGTFTDLVAIDEEKHTLYTRKEPSTPSRPVAALQAVLENSQVDLQRGTRTVLGTTVATNAILERNGAQVLFLTTQGIEDVLFIQRINRPHNYDLRWQKPAPLVKRRHCLGVNERINYKGVVVQPLTDEELRRVGDQVEAITIQDEIEALAICLLFAYVNPEHEAKLDAYLRKRFPDLPQSVSHQLVPIWREYERSSTTVADAFVKPLIMRYVTDARCAYQNLAVSGVQCLMKSNGGMTLLDIVVDRPSDTLLSGLVAGVIAGNFFGQLTGYENLITLDLGGTSCDVGLIVDGQPRYTTGFEIEWGLPVSVPVVDVTTIGAGGGSIAWVDRGGFLRVGPQSAGADPGPAAYGAGGEQPTVTDANLVLGRLNPTYFLGGRIPLYQHKSEIAIAGLAQKLEMSIQESAMAIVKVVNDNMASAMRLLTVEKGIDPRNFTLVVFGGAGPLHASSLARLLQIPRIVIPIYPGLGSAFGALIADVRVDKVWTQAFRSDNLDLSRVRAKFRAMVKEAQDELRQQGYFGETQLFLSISMRYLEQNYEEDIYISSADLAEEELHQAYRRFHDRQRQFYGYAFPNETIELLHFKVSAVGPVQIPELPRLDVKAAIPKPTYRPVVLEDGLHEKCPVFHRDRLPPGFKWRNPAIIEEIDSTILIETGDTLLVDEFGNIVIESRGSLQ
jgi:N-methylhydantoinase A